MKKEHITPTDEERATLTALLAKGSLKARTFKRATGLLELVAGKVCKLSRNCYGATTTL